MLAASATLCETEVGPRISKPTPGDWTANIQLLGVNDFHGNLEPISNATYRTPTGNIERGPITCNGGPAGGAAFLDAHLDQYVSPFDNQVVKMELTGDQIYRILEQQFEVNRILQISGFQYTFNASNSAGQRITSVTINGAPLDRNATYTVAANSFLATGGDEFTVFKEASASQQTLGSDLDALEDYVGSLQQPFSVPSDFGQRITRQG